jgi:hypothetical protein
MSLLTELQIVGVHPVDEAPDPCFLIELSVGEGLPPLDLTAITQPADEGPSSGWQAPIDPHLLDASGTSGQPLDAPARALPTPARVAFFFHFLALDRPLLTPLGPLQLPAPTPRPARLAFLRYGL